MKSWRSSIWKDFISGVAMTTLGLPPLFSTFASISPNVLETESLPGATRTGPRITSGLALLSGLLFGNVVAVLLNQLLK